MTVQFQHLSSHVHCTEGENIVIIIINIFIIIVIIVVSSRLSALLSHTLSSSSTQSFTSISRNATAFSCTASRLWKSLLWNIRQLDSIVLFKSQK